MKTHFKLYVRETSISFIRYKSLKISKYEYIFLTDKNMCVLSQLNSILKLNTVMNMHEENLLTTVIYVYDIHSQATVLNKHFCYDCRI